MTFKECFLTIVFENSSSFKKGFILATNPTYNFKQNQTQTICNKQSDNPSQCALCTHEK